LELLGKNEESIQIVLMWQKYKEALEIIDKNILPNSKLCLIIKNPFIKIDHTETAIPSDIVVSHFIEKHPDFKYEAITKYLKKTQPEKEKKSASTNVLLYQKVG
jgi:hypothetical protein